MSDDAGLNPDLGRTPLAAARERMASLRDKLRAGGSVDSVRMHEPPARPDGARERLAALGPLITRAAIVDVAPSLGQPERALIDEWNRNFLSRRLSNAPMASVVIAGRSSRETVVHCLASIAQTSFSSLDTQFIVVDDGSSDGTADVVTRLDIDFARSGQPQGFAEACNRGASIANGKYLCFLSDATEVRSGWLDHLVTIAEEDDSIGVVGAKLIYPDGRLKSAGGIMWQDAIASHYGRFGHPNEPQYNFVRDVDFVASTALLVRSDLFRKLHGFSKRLSPADYADGELCFGVRSLGYRVIYQPLSEVVHHEALTTRAEDSADAKRSGALDRSRFSEAWAAQLRGHLVRDPANVYSAARRINRQQVALIVDSSEPRRARDPDERLMHVVKVLRQIGFSVVLLPDDHAGLARYTRELQQLGVEVLHAIDGGNGKDWRGALDEVTPYLNLAWIASANLFAKYEPLVRRNAATKVIYDAVGPDSAAPPQTELDYTARADATVVVTEERKDAFEQSGARCVYVVPGDSAATAHAPARWVIELRLRELLGGVHRRKPLSYEAIINLGRDCQVAHQMLVHKLRRYALPFDYLVTSAQSVGAMLEQKFAGFLDPLNFVLRREEGWIEDLRYGTQILHDFPIEDGFLSDYEMVRDRYQRRIDRLFSILESSRRLIFIRTGVTREEALELDATLTRLYPRLDYLLVALDGTAEMERDWELPRIKNLFLRQATQWVWTGDDGAWSEIFAGLGLDSMAGDVATEDG